MMLMMTMIMMVKEYIGDNDDNDDNDDDDDDDDDDNDGKRVHRRQTALRDIFLLRADNYNSYGDGDYTLGDEDDYAADGDDAHIVILSPRLCLMHPYP